MSRLGKVAVVTGDVHHPLGGSRWDRREAEFALEYTRIAMELDAKITLFVTGRCVEKCADTMREIRRLGGASLEFGGHTYSGFHDLPSFAASRALHLAFKAVSGCLYGPRWYQRRDIDRTIEAFRRVLGVQIRSWRTHMFESNRTTYELLAERGFKAVSDKRMFMLFRVRRVLGGLHEVYLTAPPDGVIRPGDEEWNRDWRESYWNYLRAEASRGASVVLLLHPKRMAMLDGLRTFREILRFLKKEGYTFVTMSEAVEIAAEEEGRQ